MSHTVYNLVHLLGIFLLVAAVSGMSAHAANGGTKRESTTYRLNAIMHGIGAFLILLGGFRMLARLGIVGDLPGWIWAKLVIWILLGAAMALPYRMPQHAKKFAVLIPFLALLAGWFALYKPF